LPHFNCRWNTNFCQAMRSIATRWFASTGAFQSAILFKMLAVLPTPQCDSIVKQMNKYLSSWSENFGNFWGYLKVFWRSPKGPKTFMDIWRFYFECLLVKKLRNCIPHKIRFKISCILSIWKLMRYLSLTLCHVTTYFSCYLWEN